MKIPYHAGAAAFLGSLVIRLLGLTWRIEWRNPERLERARRMSKQLVFGFWHGRLLPLSYTHRNQRIQVLASHHADGDLMGRIIVHLGFGHRKGSTSRGGAAALRDLSGLLREGYDVGLTVDGPRGPRGVVQQGAIELARMTGSAVVPITNAARGRRLFDSWDRFQVPHPFAKVIVAYGEPFMVPPDADRNERERLRARLERELADLTTAIDRDLGYSGADAWPHENR